MNADPGLEVNEYRFTGLQTGNADLADQFDQTKWTPWEGGQFVPSERMVLAVDFAKAEAFAGYSLLGNDGFAEAWRRV